MNKETSVDGLSSSNHCSVVRPKERIPQQNPFMRGNTIIRSKTFSPGPQSQYICRVTDACSIRQLRTSSFNSPPVVYLELFPICVCR